MTASELVTKLARQTGVTKTAAREVLDAITTTLREELAAGNPVRINGFGVFTTAQRPKFRTVSPLTGDPITVPARRIVRFRALQTLKDRIA